MSDTDNTIFINFVSETGREVKQGREVTVRGPKPGGDLLPCEPERHRFAIRTKTAASGSRASSQVGLS